ncbi:MAG: CAP domain-containing protein, partial [Bacteroidales bacterium]|nr:CAP domain-containing protein [Bacteroidales bacterium]
NNNNVLTEREKAIKDYEDNYIGSLCNDPGWTGSTTGCVAGTISQEARTKVLQRLNYFRRLCGLEDNVVENPAQHQACQEASLIFKAEGNLSHFPPSGWKCWTQDGYNAAGKSNIAIGSATSGDYCVHSTYGITGFIEDAGANNKPVGHRAWFLLPGLQKIGIGSTNTTSCIMWEDNFNPSAAGPDFVAYPAAGYMPNQLVFPRWSFSNPGGAGYTGANVEMTDETGANVSLNIVHKGSASGGWPDSRIVWEPNVNVSNIVNDVKYTVTVSGITGAPESSYTYEVIIFPATPSYKKIAGEKGGMKIIK